MKEDHYLKKELYDLVKKDERIFDFLQEGSLDGLWYWDLEKPENEWMNRRFWTVLGYDPGEMPHLASAWQDIINQDDLKKAIDNFQKHVKDPNHPYDQEVRYTHKNGSIVWIRCRGIAIRDDHGKALRMLGAHQDITALKQSEVKIKETAETFRQILKHNLNEVAVLDTDLRYVMVSDRYMEVFKLNDHDIIGKHHYEVFSEIPDKWKEIHQRALKGEILSNEDDIFLRADGSVDAIRWECRPWHHPDGSIAGIVIYSEIITERKAAEEKLKQSESYIRSLIETASDGIYLMDDTGCIIETNQGAVNMLQRSREDIIGSPIDTVDPNFPLDQFFSFWENQPFDQQQVFETTHVTKTGVQIPIEISGKKFKIGRETFYYGIARDITDRKKAKEEFVSLAEMLDAAPNAITIHDEKGNFFFVNQSSYEMHGYTREEYMSLNLDQLDTPESAVHIPERVARIMKEGFGRFEVEHFKKDGSKIPMEIYVKQVSWNGTPALLSIGTDITERKKWEKELINAKESAEKANRLKTEFLNNMSHEIRTPMNGIIGFSKLLDQSNLDKEKLSYYTRIIQNSSQQLLRVIEDILEISILETRQEKLYEDDFCLNDFLMELFSVFNLKSKDRNIPLYINKAFDDSSSTITSDKSKLNKILSNLIENALKFTSEGFIELGYYVKDENLHLYVKDTGIGISAENTERIFERFSQEDREVSLKHGGLGLGLSISKENAQLLGGDISVESEKGKGSTFTLTIPYKSGIKKPDIPGGETSRGNRIKGAGIKILVAEDEEVNYMYIEALLEGAKKEIAVVHARNGKEAVEYSESHDDIDIILMDLKMPLMNGLEAAKIIKEKIPELPIIAQTAYSTHSDRKLALENGCDDFISKPISEENLFALINNYIKTD